MVRFDGKQQNTDVWYSVAPQLRGEGYPYPLKTKIILPRAVLFLFLALVQKLDFNFWICYTINIKVLRALFLLQINIYKFAPK